jgi:hypothetical protein
MILKITRLEVEDKDMLELNKSVYNTKDRGKGVPNQEDDKYSDEYFKVSIYLLSKITN